MSPMYGRKRLSVETNNPSHAPPAYDSRHPVLHRVVLSPWGGLIRFGAVRAATPTDPDTGKAAPTAVPKARRP